MSLSSRTSKGQTLRHFPKSKDMGAVCLTSTMNATTNEMQVFKTKKAFPV